mmetsp:Transcript_40363/g.59859  ORF Transcript_40363/g.59859 Transcript_40363/m.59859 type:complete len:409 (-) Transcript_40363:102-1328(-)
MVGKEPEGRRLLVDKEPSEKCQTGRGIDGGGRDGWTSSFPGVRISRATIILIFGMVSLGVLATIYLLAQTDYREVSQTKSAVDKTPPPPSPLYFNLSCPFEWSKYSCAHQGQLDRAVAAREYAAAHILWSNHQEARNNIHNRRRRILLVGDSTIRQVFIALGCRYWMAGLIEDFRLDWHKWPCHGTWNCVEKGNHAGFNVGSIRLMGDTQHEIHFLPHSGSLGKKEPNIVERWIRELQSSNQSNITFGRNLSMPTLPESLVGDDMIVYNVGIHNSVEELRSKLQTPAEFGRLLLDLQKGDRGRSLPKLTVMTSVTQHFPTANGQYDYDADAKNKTCVSSVEVNPRREVELEVWQVGENTNEILDYGDSGLGKHHIDMNGKDCTHYCLPGPPDVVASRLVQQVFQHLSN